MLETLFEEELASLNIKLQFNKLLFGTLLLSSIASLLMFYFLQLNGILEALVSLVILILPSVLLYFFLDYFRFKKRNEIELALPEVLYQISTFPENNSMEVIIQSISKKENALGREFGKAKNLILAGFPTSDALRAVSGQNDSPLLKRTIALLLESYTSGGELNDALKEIAEEIQGMQALRKEAASNFALQKYTLLAGVGILVPSILGLLIGISSSLDFGDEGIIEIADNSELVEAVIISVQIYFFLLSIMSSAFIAMQEGKVKKAPLYFTILFSSSILLFNILREITVF